MDKDQVIAFIKNNVFALCCGVVAIAAVVGAYYPFGGMVTKLHATADEEAGAYSRLGAFTKQRHLPNVDPAKATPGDLSGFPTEGEVKLGQAAVKKLTDEADAAMNALNELNGPAVHPVLVPDVLPDPRSDTSRFTFLAVYKQVMSVDPTVSGLGSPADPPPVQAKPAGTPNPQVPMPVDDRLATVHAVNLRNDILRAGSPPTPALIEARKQWLTDNVFKPQLITDASGVAVNQADVTKNMADALKVVPDQLADEIAKSYRVYMDDTAFPPNASLLATSNPQMTDIWFAQQLLWLQADIAKAVADIDGASHGVAESPVKRLLRLETRPVPLYMFPRASGGNSPAGPSTTDEKGQLSPTYAVSPSGRTSNGMYDVVPFRVTVDVEADHINQFIATLTRGKLIYIYNQDFYSFDPASLVSTGYLYGSKPVVRLTLSGEELFLRRWTAPLMPLPVKYVTGLATPPAGTPGAPPTPGGPDQPQGM